MNNKKKLIGLAVLAALLILSIGVYNYVYKARRDIASEKVAHELSAKNLSDVLQSDELSSSYIDKVIQTHGKITSIEHNTIVIDHNVQVSFENNTQGLALESPISIKGRCVGYDDLLEVVKIDQAIIINSN